MIWAGPFVQVTHQKKTGVHRRLTPQAMATPVPILFGTLRPLTPTPQPRLILGADLMTKAFAAILFALLVFQPLLTAQNPWSLQNEPAHATTLSRSHSTSTIPKE